MCNHSIHAIASPSPVPPISGMRFIHTEETFKNMRLILFRIPILNLLLLHRKTCGLHSMIHEPIHFHDYTLLAFSTRLEIASDSLSHQSAVTGRKLSITISTFFFLCNWFYSLQNLFQKFIDINGFNIQRLPFLSIFTSDKKILMILFSRSISLQYHP